MTEQTKRRLGSMKQLIVTSCSGVKLVCCSLTELIRRITIVGFTRQIQFSLHLPAAAVERRGNGPIQAHGELRNCHLQYAQDVILNERC